jgi:hypothetical protein
MPTSCLLTTLSAYVTALVGVQNSPIYDGPELGNSSDHDSCVDYAPISFCMHVSAASKCDDDVLGPECSRTCGRCVPRRVRVYLYPSSIVDRGLRWLRRERQPLHIIPQAIVPLRPTLGWCADLFDDNSSCDTIPPELCELPSCLRFVIARGMHNSTEAPGFCAGHVKGLRRKCAAKCRTCCKPPFQPLSSCRAHLTHTCIHNCVRMRVCARACARALV